MLRLGQINVPTRNHHMHRAARPTKLPRMISFGARKLEYEVEGGPHLHTQ